MAGTIERECIGPGIFFIGVFMGNPITGTLSDGQSISYEEINEVIKATLLMIFYKDGITASMVSLVPEIEGVSSLFCMSLQNTGSCGLW